MSTHLYAKAVLSTVGLCKGAGLILSVELWISLSVPGWSRTAHHCKWLNNNTNSAVQGAVTLYVWTDSEVVLLLNITLEYYVRKLIKHKNMSPDISLSQGSGRAHVRLSWKMPKQPARKIQTSTVLVVSAAVTSEIESHKQESHT